MAPIEVGAFVTWGDEYGRVDLVVRDGEVPGVADGPHRVDGEPAARVVLWEDVAGGYRPTGLAVAVKTAELARADPPQRAVDVVTGMAQLVTLVTDHLSRTGGAGPVSGAAVKTVYERGLTAWPGPAATTLTRHEWAYARAATFLAYAAGDAVPTGYRRDLDLLDDLPDRKEWKPDLHPRDGDGRFARVASRHHRRPALPSAPSAPPTPAGGKPRRMLPALANDERATISGYGWDHDTSRPAALREAATAVRARQPVTADQAAALADAIRQQAGTEPAPQKRRLERVAARLDSHAAELTGIAPQHVPDKVTKVKPHEVTAGDVIAVPGKGGKADVRTVVSAGPGYRRVGFVRMELEAPDGTREERAFSPDADLYRLPDGPPDVVPDVTRTNVDAQQVADERARVQRAVADALAAVERDSYRHAAVSGGFGKPDLLPEDSQPLGDRFGSDNLDRLRAQSLSLADLLAPDATLPEKATLSGKLLDVVAEVDYRAHQNVSQAVLGIPPSDRPAVLRKRLQDVMRQYHDKPPTADHDRVAQALADLKTRMADVPNLQDPPRVPDTPDLAARAAAYRAAMGGELGKKRGKYRLPDRLDLADLEAGKAPELAPEPIRQGADKAPDGGPGEHTMRQLAVVRAMGADMHTELKRRVAADVAAHERDRIKTDQELVRLDAEAQRRIALGDKLRDELARKEGYPSWRALIDVKEFGDAGQRLKAGRAARAVRKAFGEQMTPEMDLTPMRDLEKAAFARQDKARLGEATSRRQHALELIAEARGEQMANLGDLPPGSRGGMGETLAMAAESYPQSWLAKFRQKYKTLTTRSTERGHFGDRGTEAEIALSTSSPKTNDPRDKGRGAVAIHELGHGMEAVIPGLSAAENALLWDRTSQGPIGSRTRENLSSISVTTPNEIGWRDEFPERYTGKVYPTDDRYFEVFTTAVESLLGGSAYLDEDLTNWVLGVMALL